MKKGQQSQKSHFDKQKVESLASTDLSRKGSVDEPIREFLTRLNEDVNFFSLSSCSGRIVILRRQTRSSEGTDLSKKQGCDWILVSHEPVDPEHSWTAIQDSLTNQGKITDGPEITVSESETEKLHQGIITLKFEPFILHIQCKDLEAAKKLHTQSIESGFRNSGLTLGRAGKIVLAVRSTHGLEVPLTHPVTGKLMVSKEYLQVLVDIANKKLAENFRRIRIFEEKCNFHIFKP